MRFSYIARDKEGKKITGVEDVASREELITQLQGKNLIVINILTDAKARFKDKSETATVKVSGMRHYRVTNEDMVLFCRQLATLLGAAVTLLKSLEVISKQVASRRLYNVIKDLQKNMEQGLSLHEAMAKHPSVFSELWVNLVESGEAGGSLSVVLNRLAAYLERRAEFKKKIISALMYPMILMVAALGALLFLTIKIIPTFAELFKSFNLTLPFLTQVLIMISNFFQKNFLMMFVVTVVGIFLFNRFIRTKEGRRLYENFKFRLPIFGDFFRALVVERFCSNIATLIESGVPILYSLEITERSVGNLIMADIVRKIKEEVRQGRPLSQPLEKSGFFEPMLVQMVTVGEEIGELSQMLQKINTYYQGYMETFLGRFTSMFEPLLLIFMGGVIGLMVVGMFLPIFQLAKIGGVQ